jgi:hypothetical protein
VDREMSAHAGDEGRIPNIGMPGSGGRLVGNVKRFVSAGEGC